jgi:hypothetical protein
MGAAPSAALANTNSNSGIERSGGPSRTVPQVSLGGFLLVLGGSGAGMVVARILGGGMLVDAVGIMLGTGLGLAIAQAAGLWPKKKSFAPRSQPRAASGWWVVPAEVRVARSVRLIGLICGLPMALGFAGFTLLFPVFVGPLDARGMITLGLASGLFLVLGVQALVSLRGLRLSLLSFLAIPLLFFGVAWLVNRYVPDLQPVVNKQDG